MLDWSVWDREAEVKQGVNVDEIKAKLMGAHAAYSRGLTPKYEVCREYIDMATVMSEDPTGCMVCRCGSKGECW